MSVFSLISLPAISHSTPRLRYEPGKLAGSNCSPPQSGHYRLVLQRGAITGDYSVRINLGNCPIHFRKEQHPELNLGLSPAPLLCCGPAHSYMLMYSSMKTSQYILVTMTQSICTLYSNIFVCTGYGPQIVEDTNSQESSSTRQ